MNTGAVFRTGMAAAAGVMVVLAGVLAIWTVKGILILTLVALFIAVSLDPAVRWLVRHHIRRPFAVALILVILTLSTIAVCALLGPPLVEQAKEFSDDLPTYIDDFNERSRTFRDLSNRYGLGEHLTKLGSTLPERIGESVVNFFQSFLGFLGASLTVLVLTIYFMADLPRIRRWMQELAPERHRARVKNAVDVVVDKVGTYMMGNLFVSLIAGIVAYVGLSLLDVPFALPLALIVAVTDLIPLVGATIGATICVIVALISGGIWPTAILTLVLFIVYQQVENYVIVPRVMRHSLDMSSLVVLLAGLMGATLLGLVGALMAIPIAATIKAIYMQTRGQETV